MKKVMVVFGTRPEAIKMCPLVMELKKRKEVETLICVTGQHKEMLNQVLSAFNIEPDINLDIMKESQTLSSITSSVIEKMDQVIKNIEPDIILVHGDTTTTFAAALASFYNNVPVGHVEAGLRTYNIRSPFPEEFNRQAVRIVSELNFAPTQTAAENLKKESAKDSSIFITGNTAIDALKTTVSEKYNHEVISWAEGSRLILITAHRRENIGRPMKNMFSAIRRIVDEFEDIKVVYPIHLNPKVREYAKKYLGDNDRIRLIEPLDVLDFHNFMKKSYLILTDSGGIQEEAPSLGKPVLVMRDTTERPEGIKAGTLKLTGVEEEAIYNAFKELLLDENEYSKMSKASNPYGDGKASVRIADIVIEYLKNH